MTTADGLNSANGQLSASEVPQINHAHFGPAPAQTADSRATLKSSKYDQVAALLLGWEEGYCDTSSGPELKELCGVLHGSYGYDVETRLMNTVTSPQQQAFKHLSDFVIAHDKKARTLLIIYYVGHGYPSSLGTGFIALSGKSFYYEKEAKVAVSIEWHEVERTLVGTQSDVLLVFDCCHAGLLCKSAQEGRANKDRLFQYIGACESGQRTKSKGDGSFTSAMIWALKDLYGQSSFPVTQLVGRIGMHKDFPPGQRPVLFGCRFDPVSENIHLAPMRASTPCVTPAVVADNTSERTTQSVPTPTSVVPWTFTMPNLIESARVLVKSIRDMVRESHTIDSITRLKGTVVRRWRKIMHSPRRLSNPVINWTDTPGMRDSVQHNTL